MNSLLWIDFSVLFMLIASTVLQCKWIIQHNDHVTHNFLLLGIILVHLIGMLSYWNYIAQFNYRNDLITFYERSISPREWLLNTEILGTKFMYALHYPLVQMGLHYFTISAIGAFISLQAFLQLFKYFFVEQKYVLNSSWNTVLILYLLLSPNMHYWTAAGLGKDALIFVAYTMLAIQVMKHGKLVIHIIPWLALIFIIRPHSALIICIAIVLYALIVAKMSQLKKSIIIAISSIGIIWIIYFFITKILKYEDLSLESIKIFITFINESLSSGAHPQLLEMNYASRNFQLLFGPTLFDLHKSNFIFAAIENLVLLIITIGSIYLLINNKRLGRQITKVQIFLLLNALGILASISFYIVNWGWAMRAKVPIVLLIILYFIDRFKSINKSDKQLV